MDRVIVTVERREWGDECDLDLPADAAIADLLRELALAWGSKEEWAIYAYPSGQPLSPYITLAQAKVQDGARLVLAPAHVATINQPPAGTTAQPPPNAAPVHGWRPLGITLPPSASPDPAPLPKGGFIWKRVDDET